jgi:cytochrome c biogenesis protein CcdA
MTDVVTTTLFTNASLVVAFIGGMVMLFAPCCLTVMFPAYFGSAFHTKSRVLLMTLVFAAGVATIMLPIVLGARFIASFFSANHETLFISASLLMITVGLMALFNVSVKIPYLSTLRSPKISNGLTVYLLGIVSGASSTCCAPVLLGALSLAAISPSWFQAAGVGIAYTLGMVFPLLVFGLLMERSLWKTGMKLRTKSLTLGGQKFLLTNLVTFVIFTGTGLVFLYLTLSNRLQATQNAAQFGITFKNWGDTLAGLIDRIPYGEALFGGLLLLMIGWVIYAALQRPALSEPAPPDDEALTHHSKAITLVDKGINQERRPMSTYACPMHPEETSEDPNARCTLCGMALEPVEAPAPIEPTCDKPTAQD